MLFSCKTGEGPPTFTVEEDRAGDDGGRNTQPQKLAPDYIESAGAEESEPDRGDFDRAERKKVARVIEWREKCDAQAAIGHRV